MSEELTLSTAPTSKRFPTTNQAKACYMCASRRAPRISRTNTGDLHQPTTRELCVGHRYYNSWHQCKYDYSDEEPQCAKLKGWAYSMCPMEWVRFYTASHHAACNPPH